MNNFLATPLLRSRQYGCRQTPTVPYSACTSNTWLPLPLFTTEKCSMDHDTLPPWCRCAALPQSVPGSPDCQHGQDQTLAAVLIGDIRATSKLPGPRCVSCVFSCIDSDYGWPGGDWYRRSTRRAEHSSASAAP